MVHDMIRALWIVVLLVLACGGVAEAQTCNGLLPPGTVCGNPTVSPGAGRPAPLSAFPGGGGGGDASTVLSVATPAALAAATIPATIQVVAVTSMSGTQPVTNGQSNCGLIFRRGTGTPEDLYGEVLNSGVYWEPIYSTSPVKTCEFGAIGDNTTDATPAIQAAIDYAIRYGFDTVCLNDGDYKTTDTLQLGYGGNLQQASNMVLAGCDNARNSYPNANLGGPQITPMKVDRCAVNFQGARMGGVKGIAFNGAAGVISFINGVVAAPPFPSAMGGWFPSAYQPGGGSNPLAGTVASGGTNQYAPYAAICVDAYTGLEHTNNHYPNVTYPPWTGIVTQYSKNASSDITLQDIGITGFAVGIVVSPNSDPAGTDANGDFVKLNRITCIATTICGSIGQTQSRNVEFANIIGDAGWALYTNDTFGTQSGNTTGYCENVHAGRSYQLFSINMNIQPFFTCKAMYGEELVRIGKFHDGASFSGSLTLEDCNFNFDDSIHLLSPTALVEYTQVGAVFFKSCTLANISRMQTLVHSAGNVVNVSIEGGSIQAGGALGWVGATSAASGGGVGIMQANNFGTLFLGDSYAIQSQVTASPLPLVNWKVPTQVATMATSTSDGGSAFILMGHYPIFQNNNRRTALNQAISGLSDLRAFITEFAYPPSGGFVDLVTGGLTSPAPSFSSCDVMTFGWLDGAQASSRQDLNIHVGDFLYHQPSGTIFAVTNVGANVAGFHTITTRQMNNMTLTNTPNIGTCATSLVDQTVAGNSYLIHTSGNSGPIIVPMVTFFCDFAEGSTSGLYCGPVNGEGITNSLASGDPIYGMYNLTGDIGLQWPFDLGTTIATVTLGPPASITLSLPALITGRFPVLPLPVRGVGQVGRLSTDTGLPTIACNAGTGAVVSGSTNKSGNITSDGTGKTSCTLSWSSTLAAAPKACTFFPANATAADTNTTRANVGAPSTTQVVLSGSALANANYSYLCQ